MKIEEIFITEEELEYLTNIPQTVCEEAVSLKPQMSFVEEARGCITLEQFSKKIDEAIKRLIPNP